MEEIDVGFVYLWENVYNKKYYIGSHKGYIDDGYIGSGKYFKRAYRKNPNSFIRKILYVGCDFLNYEQELLEFVDAKNNDKFYNLVNKVGAGWHPCHTEEARAKRVKSITGIAPKCAFRDKDGSKNPMYGKNHSEVTKNKISKSKKGIRINNKRVIEVTSNLIFDSIGDCANYFGIKQPTMSHHLIKGKKINRGKLKGKLFKYE